MSWIIGAIPRNKNSFDNSFFLSSENIKLKYKSNKFEIYAGGFSKNLHFVKNSNLPSNGGIVSGIGFQNNNVNTKILSNDDWTQILSSKNSNNKINNLDGHFVIVEWDENLIKIQSDVLGLRDIYIAEDERGIYFSTNVVWLSKIVNLDINFYEFGSRWLLFNQVSDKSIFKGIHRIVAGKSAEISISNNPTVIVKDYNWLPTSSEKQFGVEEYSAKLSSLINLNLQNGNQLSLSLSGGMDSRVILSYLLKNYNNNFDTHTFGKPNHPDSIIAKEIVTQLGIEHEQLNTGLPSVDETVVRIKEYASETLVNNAASAFLQLQNYSFLNGRNTVLIDGGFGEIWRREFFYRLFLKGKDALLKQDAKKMIPHLRLYRVNIFNDEISDQMEEGIQNQLDELINKMPPIDTIKIGNWLELFALKTRLPNYYLHEQTRLDNSLTSMMPFIQQSLVNDIFTMPEKLRQNGKLFRQIIKNNAPVLEKYKFAKGQSVHPYFFNSLQSRLWSIAQRKLKIKVCEDKNVYVLLESLKEYILDISSSKEIKENKFYDYTKVKTIVEGYYNGNLNLANELDWWLSFELFRQSFTVKS
ncbi:MAG: hypothetical protein GY936_19200 [Ignavibacteriae bacterium]|nr:hypothetical protein [Ignavibacteriota bacterium]